MYFRTDMAPATIKLSEYRKQASLSDATAKQLSEWQQPNGVNLGHPWIHTGFECSGCNANPITGFLYKNQRCEDYYLCEDCYRQQPSDEINGYLQFERAASAPPLQIYCVQCKGCGVAPIQGPRYRHKTDNSHNLCAVCYGAVQAGRLIENREESPTAYEYMEETPVKSARKMYSTVFHFGVKCDGCKSSPICGPRYCLKFDPECLVESFTPAEVNFCLVCFDERFVSGDRSSVGYRDRKAIARKFRRIPLPDGRSVIHIDMLSCRLCNVTPISGPAFKKENDSLCIFCYSNLKREKQAAYTRCEPPAQLSPILGNITESEVKKYIARRKPSFGGEEKFMNAAMVAQLQQQFRYKGRWNQANHNLWISQEIDSWNLKIQNPDGSWSWAFP